jgi:hypothetical protein
MSWRAPGTRALARSADCEAQRWSMDIVDASSHRFSLGYEAADIKGDGDGAAMDVASMSRAMSPCCVDGRSRTWQWNISGEFILK